MKLALTILLVLLGSAFVHSKTVGQKLDSTIDAASEGVQDAADAVKETAKGKKN